MTPDNRNPASAAAPTGSGDIVCFSGNPPDSPPRTNPQVKFRNPRAVKEARLELLREAIFENLGAVSLFTETAKLLIEAGDDAGMAHSVKMGAHHYRAAVVSAKELAALKAVAP